MCFQTFQCDWVLGNETSHDKTNKMALSPAKTHISLGICRVWSASSLSAWRKLAPLATHWAHREDSDQTGRMPRLIWVFAGRRVVLSAWRKLGSLATHWAHNEGSDQSRWMPRLIWVFAGRTVNLLVLSWGGSNKGFKTLELQVISPYWQLLVKCLKSFSDNGIIKKSAEM